MKKLSEYAINSFIVIVFSFFLLSFCLKKTPYVGIVFAATPSPSPPTVSDDPDPQAGGSTVTFSLTCDDPANNDRGYICKASDCSSCVYGTTTNCWCANTAGAASNPSCGYSLPSCCSGITVGNNNYYGRCQSTEATYEPYTAITSVQTFACKKENVCTCSAGSECYSTACISDPDDVGAWCCNSNQCSHDGACINNLYETSTAGGKACVLAENIVHETAGTTNYRYCSYNGQLYYSGMNVTDVSPYSVINFIPGDKVGACQAVLTQGGTDAGWNCGGVVNVRGGRIRIS